MTPRRLLVCPASKSASRRRRKQQRRCCSLFCVLFCSLTCLVFAGCVAARHPSKHHNRGAHLLLQGISAKEIGGFHLQEQKQPSRRTSPPLPAAASRNFTPRCLLQLQLQLQQAHCCSQQPQLRQFGIHPPTIACSGSLKMRRLRSSTAHIAGR